MLELPEFDESYFSGVCLAISEDAADLRELLRRGGNPTSRALDDLEVVLDQATELRLAVIGDFKRGKSSVINAVVGEPILPTDVLPCTSGIIELVHGQQTEYELVHDGISRLRSREEFLAGAGSASSVGSPGDADETWRVRTPLMPRGFVLVDTPGLNEDEWRIARTHVEASRCHASLLVLAADQPLSRSEREILELLPLDSTAFLLNRSDLVRPDDLARISDHVAQRLPSARSVEPQLWSFSAVGHRTEGSLGLTTADELRGELTAFVSERSLSSRAQRVIATVDSATTELRRRAADRVEVLEGSTSGLRSAHEQALEELDRARATSRRIVRLLEESADRISLETSDALRDDWDDLLKRWAATSRRWRSRHPLYDLSKLKRIAKDMARDALKEFQRELDEWITDRVDGVIVSDWDEAVDAVALDVTEFLRSLDRVAPRGATQGLSSLRDLRPEGAVQVALARSVAGGALALGVGATVRVLLLKQLTTVVATRLPLIANPVGIAAGIALLVFQATGFKDELRRQVRKAMRRELKKPETIKVVRGDVRKSVRDSLEGDIRDVRVNLDAWIDDAQGHAMAKWSDIDDTETELATRRRYRDEVAAVCDRMGSRLQPLQQVQSG